MRVPGARWLKAAARAALFVLATASGVGAGAAADLPDVEAFYGQLLIVDLQDVSRLVDVLEGAAPARPGAACVPAGAGVFTQHLTSSDGCDSVVITTVDLLPSDQISLFSTTCVPCHSSRASASWRR